MPQYDGGPVSRIRSAPVRFPNQGAFALYAATGASAKEIS